MVMARDQGVQADLGPFSIYEQPKYKPNPYPNPNPNTNPKTDLG